ncbi:hypothetical protein ACFE04_009747 [Oxalis oulophora]
MNSSNLSVPPVAQDPTEGDNFNYHIGGVGVYISVFIILIVFSIGTYICFQQKCRRRNLNRFDTPPNWAEEAFSEITLPRVLSEATIQNFPTSRYSEVKAENVDLEAGPDESMSSCGICLMEYDGDDMLRILPRCGHRFHLTCVDVWLRKNPTCPVCRHTQVPRERLPPPISRARIRQEYFRRLRTRPMVVMPPTI